MSTPIDERTAWNLVRAVPPGLAGTGSARVQHNPKPDVWLQVHASGQWEASAELTADARDVIELYLPLQLRADLVIAQIGQSLDGRIATASGHSHYVTGPADILRLHRLRALVDAVIVGAGTVALDDPQLTVRKLEGRSPVRVVLDPDDRLDPDSRVFSDGSAPTLVVRRAPEGDRGPSGAPAPASDEGEVLRLPIRGADGFDPEEILQALRARGYRRVLVEGGGITVSRFVQAQVVDRLHVTVAPLLIGSGRAALTLPAIDSLDEAIRPPCRHFHLGEDVLFDLALR